MDEDQVRFEEAGHRGAFYLERGGERLAEMTFTRGSPALIIIDHTSVSEALRGQGAGRRLLDALVAWARASGTRVVPVCPYARAQFAKDAAIRDVLQP